MEASILLLQQISILFLIMAMGFGLVKWGKLKAEDAKPLSVILVYLILPCVIIHAFQIEATPEVLQGLELAAAAAIVVHLLFIIVTAFLTRPLHLNSIEVMSTIYSNAGILIIPLITALMGPQYIIYSCAFMAVQIFFLWTHGSIVLSGQGDLRAILKNINLLAILIGVILFAWQIQLPYVLDETLNMVGQAIGPVGMLITGMSIAAQPLAKVFTRRRNYFAVILRLIIYPLLLIGAALLIPAESIYPGARNIFTLIFIASITPTAAIVTSMAQFYERDAAYAAELNLISTVLSILTMPVLLFIFVFLV